MEFQYCYTHSHYAPLYLFGRINNSFHQRNRLISTTWAKYFTLNSTHHSKIVVFPSTDPFIPNISFKYPMEHLGLDVVFTFGQWIMIYHRILVHCGSLGDRDMAISK